MFEQVKKVIVDAVHIDDTLVIPTATLKEDLGIDSLAAVELALELETNFDVRIDDAELVNLVTVQDVVDLITSKLN